MQITGTDFVTLSSTDIERSVAFYGGTLGLPESARYGQMPGVEFETGNLTIAIVESSAFGMEPSAHTHPVALHVDDVAAARTELEAARVAFGGDTMDTGVCHMAHFRDPDGNVLMLHHR